MLVYIANIDKIVTKMKIHLYVPYILIFAFKRGWGQGWEGERERGRGRESAL